MEPRTATLPSFNESPGCGGPDGVRGPFATRSGDLPSSEAIFGPWGDFFGRDIAAVRSQLVRRYLPSPGGAVGVWVHARVAPALDRVIRTLQREAAAGRTYRIRSWDTWSYRAATVPPGRHLSFHAVGAAIDINSTTNPYRADNVLISDLPAWFVRAWTDAGWCWGGAWQTIKDPMHFSWQGPLATPGYRAPAPFAPRHLPADFSRSLAFRTALGPSTADAGLLLADLDRDGAADAVRVRPWTPAGHLGVEAARATHGFETCTTGETTSRPAVAGAIRLLDDRDADGRPDLWEIDVSGPTAVVSVYSFASGFSRRLERTVTAVPNSPGAAFLVGDHDRDGRTDLYVVRPGNPATLEIWRHPAAAPMVSLSLRFAARRDWRFALGERDGDGIPDLFALEPGDDPRLRITPGASGFSGKVESHPLAGPARPGIFAVGDLDGDGRGDLYFLDHGGTLTVLLGGARTLPDSQLIYWFFRGHDRYWETGAGCPTPAGEHFLQVGAAALGPVAAALHSDPAGGWSLRHPGPAAPAWERAGPGEGIALAALPTPDGDRLAVLHAAAGTAVSLFTASGSLAGKVRFGALDDPVALVGLQVGGTPAVGVMAGGAEGARLVVRDFAGTRLAAWRLGPETVSLAARDADGDGTSEIVLLTAAEGRPRLRLLDLGGHTVAEAALPAWGTAESLALLSGGRPVVLWRSHSTGRAQVFVFDATLSPVAHYRLPADGGARLAAAGDTVVMVYRAQGDGAVRALARDAATGARRYRVALPAGFEPAAAIAGPAGSLVVAGHRLGDGAILLEHRAADGSLLSRVQYHPG